MAKGKSKVKERRGKLSLFFFAIYNKVCVNGNCAIEVITGRLTKIFI